MIDIFWESTAGLLAIIVFAGGIFLIGTAALSVLRERRTEDKIVAGIFAALTLLLVVTGIREYPAILQEASTEGLRRTNANAEAFRAEWSLLLSGVTDPWTEEEGDNTAVSVAPDPNAGGGAPAPETTIIAPPVTFTPVYSPTPLPTAVIMPEGTPAPSATPIFIVPTPTLQPTSVPTLDMTLWNPQTPAPTPLAGGSN